MCIYGTNILLFLSIVFVIISMKTNLCEHNYVQLSNTPYSYNEVANFTRIHCTFVVKFAQVCLSLFSHIKGEKAFSSYIPNARSIN